MPGLANGMGAAGKGLGGFGEFCGLENGRLEALLSRALGKKNMVPHLRWSQAPPLPCLRPGSADLVKSDQMLLK